MLNKLKPIMLAGALSVLSVSCLQANARGLSAESDRPIELNDKNHHGDIYSFLYNYSIVLSLHTRYEEEFGSLSETFQEDSKWVKSVHDRFKDALCTTPTDKNCPWNFPLTVEIATLEAQFTLWCCAEMYNKEINALFGSNFSPESDEPFLDDNFICKTSYKDALEIIQNLLLKSQTLFPDKWTANTDSDEGTYKPEF